jgi:hypothetical protein
LRQAERYLIVNGEQGYINKGKADGIQEGAVFQVVRPLGEFYHPFKNVKLRFPTFERRGELLGMYTQEVGFVRVVAVQEKSATIQVTEACSEIRLGDALVKFEKPQIPDIRPFVPLSPFAALNGKPTGQIVFARNERENLSSSDVVAIDLGQKSGVKVGDYLTIYREQNSEYLTRIRDDEISPRNTEGGSDRFRGSSRSIVRPSINKEKLEKDFPGKKLPLSVVGEMVVTRVEGNTATAVITRTLNGEVFLGDQVELQ